MAKRLRICGGEFRGRMLHAPEGLNTRPTSSRVREALFSILGPTIEGASVLDGFAGSGALGLEALSRGAAHVTFMESHPRALATLTRNIDALGVDARVTLTRTSLPKRLSGLQAVEFALLDPPWDKGLGIATIQALMAGDHLTPQGHIVLEERKGNVKAGDVSIDGLKLVDQRLYGDTELSFFRLSEA